MSLDSINYLYFLPVAFALYWVVPARMNTLRNCVLIALSYAFYAFCDWRFCGLLAFISLATYAAGRMMHTWQQGRYAKSIATTNVVVCLGILGVFKYLGFFAEQIAPLIGGGNLTHSITECLVVPVGVSFYVFMAISYTIDRYKKVIERDPSLVDFLAYISFFPHLLAGPIDRGREMLPQLCLSVLFPQPFTPSWMESTLDSAYLDKFAADVHGLGRRGVKVILLPPAIYDAVYVLYKTTIAKVAAALSERGVPFQADTRRFAYPVDMMYNSEYHINKLGVKTNTQNIIRILRTFE